MLTDRASGILLHPTSLPGAFGAGDFGPDAYRFIDWLVSAGQSYWQVLPLGEIGHGNSPYMSMSAFAGSIQLIDLAELSANGWLEPADLIPHSDFRQDRVDYNLLYPYRIARLRNAAKRFFASAHDDMHRSYTEFCIAESAWLDDYSLFMTIAENENGREWYLWPRELVKREARALRQFESAHAEEVSFWKFCQWCFARQWSNLRLYANDHGVRIIGDIPIFVSYQSADVWSHQELFKLDENGRPTFVAGVPPDYFSATGQFWGNPQYNWEAHEKTGYAWWVERLGHALQLADMVRIDHFRGFAAFWEIPVDAPNAISGKWVTGPGEKLFETFANVFPHLPIIAEDLGLITPDVIELRDKFNLPGMRILQFAFGDGEGNLFLPHHYVPNTVAYTGTHDNDTILGWWNTLSPHEKGFAQHYLQTDGTDIQWVMMRAISNSQANLVMFTMQDVLGLNGENRMNLPGQSSGSWEWRFSWDQVQPEHARILAEMSREYSRLPLQPEDNS
ncbi:MAG: 4-alpha-glucanotransferase [Gallionella sp.]|nr:4-alpha-glucanotransferase [Gallionella sp.]